MARYSRIRGPASTFELTAADQLVPGFSITRHWDDGELLIIVASQYFNGTAAAISPFLTVFLDGAALIPNFGAGSVPAAASNTLVGYFLQPVTAGQHTLQLHATGGAAAGDLLLMASTEFTVIQLPSWDQEAELITL